MRTVTLAHEPVAGQVAVRFAYDPPVILLMRQVPGRRWDPQRRLWTVPTYSAREVEDLFQDLGYRVEWTTQPPWWTPPPAPGRVAGDPFQELFVLVPGRLHSRVYHALAMALHPDKGGDTRLMQRLNAAYDRVREVAS